MTHTPPDIGANDIALYGRKFNPPTLNHKAAVEAMQAQGFGEVAIVPSGPRENRPVVNDIAAQHRSWMVDTMFRGMKGVDVHLDDIAQQRFSTNLTWEQRLQTNGRVWHVVDHKHVIGGRNSEIAAQWEDGMQIWENSPIAITVPDGEEVRDDDMPPHGRIIRYKFVTPERSEDARSKAANHVRIDEIIGSHIASYIDRWGVYRAGEPPWQSEGSINEQLRPFIYLDEDFPNPAAAEIATRFDSVSIDDANVIIPVGGDGVLMQAITQHWDKRLPFLGINAGHRGYLSNPPDQMSAFFQYNYLKLLHFDAVHASGDQSSGEAINDVHLLRRSGQAAWIDTAITSAQTREGLGMIMGDGVLISSPVGSTGYATSMLPNLPPLPLSTGHRYMVGNNCYNWQHPEDVSGKYLRRDRLDGRFGAMTIDSGDTVHLAQGYSDNFAKRPLVLETDGCRIGENDSIASVDIYTSRVAAVELLKVEGRGL